MSAAIEQYTEKSNQNTNSLICKLPLYNEIPGRNHYICPYECKCLSLRKCDEFKPLKKLCTQKSYICTKLLSNDYIGFCASGLCLKYRDKILFLREHRLKSFKYNFPGGGRETVVLSNGDKRPETCYETSSFEFMEEMGDLVEGGQNNPYILEISKMILKSNSNIYWSGESKYSLIILEISEELALKIKPLDKTNDGPEANIFSWIDRKDFNESMFHPYAYNYIKDIFKC